MSSVIHWLCRPGDLKTFCGIFAYLNTARAEQVTCQDCLALMRPNPPGGKMSTDHDQQQTCGHVPARPDVDMTLCWKCGVEIVPDPGTHLWRPLTPIEKLVKYETLRQLRDLFERVHPSEFGDITHLIKALEIARVLGFSLSVSPCPGEVSCANCENQARDEKP